MTDTAKLILGVAIVGVLGVTIAVVASNNNNNQNPVTPYAPVSSIPPAPGGPGDGADAGVEAVRGGFTAANTFIDRYLGNVDRQRERESRERIAVLNAERERNDSRAAESTRSGARPVVTGFEFPRNG